MAKFGLSTVLTLGILSTALFGCGKDSDKADKVSSATLKCGSNEAKVSFRVTGPEDAEQFAILLSGSPATEYFSDLAQAFAKEQGAPLPPNEDPYFQLAEGLRARGFRVLELKYLNEAKSCGSAGTMSGFYSACCAQGLEKIKAHNDDLYDIMVKKVGFDETRPNHRLVGFGFSLGAIQVQTMAFMSGKKFHKVGMTGVLLGSPEQGCSTPKNDDSGMSWEAFVHYADALTPSTEGCSVPSKNEFGKKFDFENFPHAKDGDMGMFEGGAYSTHLFDNARNQIPAPSNPGQVEYIARARSGKKELTATNRLKRVGRTTFKLYPGCGHEILFCGKALNAMEDIVEYLTDLDIKKNQ
jgi:hypothetical protein